MKALYEKNRKERLEYMAKKRLDNLELFIKRNREQYAKHREKYVTQKKDYYRKNKLLIREKEKIEIKKYPQKFSARWKACKSIVIPKDKLCEICNNKPAIQREHRDYSKPLEVQFVCASCNKRLGVGINVNE